MADGNVASEKLRVTREKHQVRVGQVDLVIPLGTPLRDLLFDAGMFLSEAMGIAEGLAGEMREEVLVMPDGLQGVRHLIHFSKDMIEAVSAEVARG